MAESIPNFTNAKIIGAGANGLIVQPDGYYVYKLFYDLSITHEEIMKEAKIQRKIHELFGQNIFNVYVPDVRSKGPGITISPISIVPFLDSLACKSK